MTNEKECDLYRLKKIGKIVAMARDEIVKGIEPGITTLELDKIGEKVLTNNGAKSAPKIEYGFPGTTCISINDEVAHGIPSQRIIREGDSVNIDVSAVINGYFADTGVTIVVGKNEIKNKLCRCSKKALQWKR